MWFIMFFVPDSFKAPTLFVLSPLQPEGLSGSSPANPGPDGCLATDFRPKEGEMVLKMNDGSQQVTLRTSKAVLSPERKAYFFAGFSNKSIKSCELHNTFSDKKIQQVRCEPKGNIDPSHPQGNNDSTEL